MPPISLKFIVEGGMIHRVHGIFGADPIPQYRCMIRQPGLTHRSTCPSIPGLGAGGTPPKIDASMDWIYLRSSRYLHPSPAISSYLQNIDPIQEEFTCTVECLFPHIPRLPQINFIVGGVYGVKNRYILFGLFVGEVPFPSHTSMCLISGLGLPSSLHFFVVRHPHTIFWLCGSFNYYYL